MRFYRALLRLYPSSYRAEYGDELAAVFAARRSADTGTLGSITTAALAIADVVPNAAAVQWDVFTRDLRYALRALRRTPGFTLTAILVVALGVGANAAAFSVADFVLLRPLPFAKPSQLVRLWESTPGYSRMEVSAPNFRDWKTQSRSFSDMAPFTTTAMNLTGSGEPRRLEITQMGWTMPRLLGVHALLGRTFVAADTVAAQAVLLGYDLWQTQFGADPGVLGRRIELDGAPYTVVGVMSERFRFPSRDTDLWMTLPFVGPDFEDRSNLWLDAVGRLKGGVTIEQAQTELRVVAARLSREYPKENHKVGSTVYKMSDDLAPGSRLLLLALCGAAVCILLLACANLANLLLVRATTREREIAVRTALGAGRNRLLRQLVTEAALAAGLGMIAGCGVAIISLPALAQLVPSTLPIADHPSLDVGMLVLASAVVAAVGMIFGVVPALRSGATLDALRDGARSGGGRRQRMRSMLVMIEVMASAVLLISSGLLMRAMWRLQSEDVGFHTKDVLTMRTALSWPKYGGPHTRNVFYTRVLSEVRALPGVSDAAYISGLPMVMRGGLWSVTLPGMPDVRNESNSASLRFATPRYFSTLGIRLRQGRDIAETDLASSPRVAVVSATFAQQYWPHEPALGKHFTFAFYDREVVGVVGDVRVRGLEQSAEPQVYLPPEQIDSASLSFYSPKDLVIRTSSPAAVLVPEVRRVVREIDPLQPISDVQMLADVVSDQTASRASQLRILEILAVIALVLAAVGLHGVLSFAVSRRAQEIGVRVALGAEPAGIVAMFLREGILLCIGGLVPGVAIAYAAGRGMQALLAGVAPGDPVTMIAGVALCAGATILGCARPALRAARTDPVSALRAE
ncbi:MAG TPA: ABC transporter permease [Gemmatimonadaceae bacterium]|jgi:putative ABC transport system permease protein|nr:ABC transporter permease [Gemmatimonadaceae bacterium]